MVRMYVSIIWYSNHKYTNNTKVFNIIQLFKCKKYEYTKNTYTLKTQNILKYKSIINTKNTRIMKTIPTLYI